MISCLTHWTALPFEKMLYDVQLKNHSYTPGEHTQMHIDLRVTVNFATALDEKQAKDFRQTTFEQVRNSLNPPSLTANSNKTRER